MEAAALESEIVTNRIRGRDDDHIARSARDVADAADGSRPLPRSQDGAADMQEPIGQLVGSMGNEIMSAEA